MGVRPPGAARMLPSLEMGSNRRHLPGSADGWNRSAKAGGVWFVALVTSACAGRAADQAEAPTTAEVTVHFFGPAPASAASVLLVRDSEQVGVTATPDAEGKVVFRAVQPGFFRVEVRHPKGLTEARDLRVEAGGSPVEAVGLKSAFLYRRESAPEARGYEEQLRGFFDRWKGGELLASFTIRPAAYSTEVLVGVARRSPSEHLAVALHAGARVADVFDKPGWLALATSDAERSHLGRIPGLAAIDLRPATRPISAALAQAITCTWRAAVTTAVPQREVGPEVVDGARYTVLVRDAEGRPQSAETETLDGRFLESGPRLRAMRLMEVLHEFCDGHLPALQLERHVQDHAAPGCAPSPPPTPDRSPP
jgi:hypothetical protein